MSTEELKVVLRRSSEYSGFGFSLLGTTGPPHVIYDIVENSPAADCGVVEAGDVILKVNGTDVHRYTTKEVLKCLRLSEDLVTLELKRDPKLKARIKEQLANTKSPHYIDIETTNNYDYHHSRTSSPHHHHQQQHHEAANKLHYDTTHNYTTIQQQQQQSPTSSSPAATRYKSTISATATNLPQRQSSNTTSNHSRSSSVSSAKIQLVEGLAGGGGGGGGGSGAGTGTSTTATSPTSRPSRIPQALKCPTQKTQQSPQHKRPRPSQIPTKASLAAAAAAAAATTTTATTNTTNGTSFMVGSNNLQHSFSYSGNTTRQGKSSSSSSYAAEERDPEPNSAPPQPAKAPRFEAYMMTGDLILNLSRTPQNSNLLPVQAKKVDSLRDSPNRAAVARANGALAPKASGESSPTSSSSQESPTHSTDSAELQNKAKSRLRKQQQAQAQKEREQEQQQQQQQYQRDSINNSYNNRKDSLTNDTLLLCEELEKDEEDMGDEDYDEEGDVHRNLPPQQQTHHKTKHHHYMQKHKQQCYQQQTRQQQQQNKSYEYYQNEDEEPDEDYERYAAEDEENEEDQTNYDITNLETYNSGGLGAGGQADDEASDRQCLMQYGDDDDEEQHEDEEYSNSVASASAKQRLKALKKQKAALRYKQQRNSQDNVDCARHQRSSASSTSSTTVGNTGAGAGNNTSQDETSFSVPTSPISLSTPLIDKETANSVPTSPEPSNLAGGSGVVCGADSSGVVRRHNGQIVRKCDSAGFRTSKSEDHLQQIQREGMGAVIPIDIDEDVNSSLNTLLDTRQDSEDSQASDRDRIVWTYNAPLQPHQLAALQQQQQQQQQQQ
ncbi:PH and SEC7 domain-containing protein-like, partial [Lucilia sericata]|uniref:PH and SEC7 domain-containing protein-like n=1 Tax=Lucilia sericata TaxID=13632 RepID=UPI0018A80E90